MYDDRPIGVMDSGVGGLSILQNLIKVFPKESFLYLGDVAYLPYGNKSEKSVRKRISKIFRFFEKNKVKAVVVACNTSCSILTKDEKTPFPLYEIIGPVVKEACIRTRNKKVGVIATPLTVSQNVYLKKMNIVDPSITVYQNPSPLLVPIIESGWIEDPILNLTAHRYIYPLLEKKIDTLVLGCTHYPIIKDKIEDVVSNQCEIISSSYPIISVLKEDFRKGVLKESSSPARVVIYTTDMTPDFQKLVNHILNPFLIDSVESTNFTSVS